MELKAYDVKMCQYRTNSPDEATTQKPWADSGYYYAGRDTRYDPSHNYVLVIRFTIDKPARKVSIPVSSSLENGTSPDSKLCYALGPNPEEDASMTNITGTERAKGSFYFEALDKEVVITLPGAKKGINYLYIWGPDSATASYTTFKINTTAATDAITYLEAEGSVYIGDGTKYVAYELGIGNGESYDVYVKYISNGTGWDPCA